MSSSNMFTNNLRETPIDSAYYFETTRDNTHFLQKGKKKEFSPICIFCSCKETVPLMQDGSFRSCNNCKKQFKSKII